MLGGPLVCAAATWRRAAGRGRLGRRARAFAAVWSRSGPGSKQRSWPGPRQNHRNELFHGRQPKRRAGYTATNGGTMSLHQERAAAVRQLVDQAREIEKSGVSYATLDRIGGLLAAPGPPRRAFPPGRVSARTRRRHLSPERGPRPSLRALRLGRRAGQESAAAQSHDLGDHRRRPRRGAQRGLRPARQRCAARQGDSCARRRPRRRRCATATSSPTSPRTSITSRRRPAPATRCTSISMASASSTCPTASRSTWRPAPPSASWPGPRS